MGFLCDTLGCCLQDSDDTRVGGFHRRRNSTCPSSGKIRETITKIAENQEDGVTYLCGAWNRAESLVLRFGGSPAKEGRLERENEVVSIEDTGAIVMLNVWDR